MHSALRDRQALKRLRKIEQSVSLRIGEHLTRSFVQPWRLPMLPLSFPALIGRIALERLGLLQKPDSRIEWRREVNGSSLMVYIDGYPRQHVQTVMEDLIDLNTLRPALKIVVVCTDAYQGLFTEVPFPVFVIPGKGSLVGLQIEEWGVILEEQLGGIASFFEPQMVLAVGPYPHRALKNLVRSNPALELIHDQRPVTNTQKVQSAKLHTHLTGVLRLRTSEHKVPAGVDLHLVDGIGMTSWLSNVVTPLEEEATDTMAFNEANSKRLISLTKDAKRDTKVISEEINRINMEFGIEVTHSLLMYTLVHLELNDESVDKRYTRDLFVAAVRSFGRTNFNHMVELVEWRLHRYQDERAAKSAIQFMRNADLVEEATPYLRFVKDKEWKKREIQNVTTKMLAQYDLDARPATRDFLSMDEVEVEALVHAELASGKFVQIKEELSSTKGGLERKQKVLLAVLKAAHDMHHPQIHRLLKEHGLFEHELPYLARRLHVAFLLHGDAHSALAALEAGPLDQLGDEVKKTRTIISKIDGTWLPSLGPFSAPQRGVPTSEHVLYLTHMSLPFESAGYCTRTHGLLTNLLTYNPSVSVQSRLGYPRDKGKLRHLTETDVEPSYVVDGLTYRFETVEDKGVGDADEHAYIERAALSLIESARSTSPAMIQAASNHVNGAIGLLAARALKVPFIYEVRGLWHMSRVARQEQFIHHSAYAAMDAAEVAVCLEADCVFAITHAVRHHLIDKGVDADRIFVLPNGADTERFQPTEQDAALRFELGLGEGIVVGYIGSFVEYEGLDLLLKAFGMLHQVRDDVHLLLVGDGTIREQLEAQVDELGITDRVRFTGRVPHHDVERYHSLIDIAPFPRTPDIVCEFISPLKPFEAMAMGQAVVASDVAALEEIIVDGQQGRLFRKGNAHSLFSVLKELVDDPEMLAQFKAAGRAWVESERDWKSLAAHLHAVHTMLLKNGPTPDLLGSGRALRIQNGQVLSVLNGKPKLMVIMDEFSTTALSADANLVRPTPENWQALLDEHRIDMLVVESAWEGNDGAWHHKVGWYSEEEIADLKQLVGACRDRNIPSVFYNKEDPVHFNRFSKTSALFDHVFTTDEGCITRYEALEHSFIQSVDWIQFAAQPDVHHPYDVILSDRSDIAFAGTYYAGKYPERCEKMDMLFDAAANHGLVIYDRQSDGGNPQYVFPERFMSYIHNKLEYHEMLQKHRKHRIFLNVNSVEDSLTMAARRIFEIPASGACLVSGPGLAVREVFGNTVPMVDSSEQAHATLNTLMVDEAFLRYTIQTSRQIVLKRHLNRHRLQKMLNASRLTLQRPSSVADTVIVSDRSTSIRDICLWFARQELEFTNLILPSTPETKAEELLLNLLRNRGLSVGYEQPEASTSPTIHIHEVRAFDHHGLELLFNEMRSTPHTVHLKSSTGDLLATCKQPTSEVEFTLEHHVFTSTSQKLISTITDHTFTGVPSTILIAGHDLKFAMPIVEVFEEMGIRVLVDKWDNHNKFDAEKSRSLLEKVDAVWCEWALGNIEWYSRAIKSGMPLFVRYHLQERNYEYLTNSNQKAISNIAFVCQHYETNAREIGQIDDTTPTSVIPNTMNIRGKYNRKNDNYSIGFVGMVPARKRLDLALDLLEELLQHDSRYTLKVVGKNPEEYGWLMKRDDEREYYQNIRSRLESNPLLKSRVEFLGFVDNIREFYSSVGHVISTSDFESYHLTLADGPLHGAAAHSLRWDGADDIYTKSWLNETISEIANSIIAQNLRNTTAYEAEKQSLHLVPQMSSEIIALSILQAIGGVSE
jgi:glycosyltransferase involved in cell wall biosynthesis/spore maturation protein CgeB